MLIQQSLTQTKCFRHACALIGDSLIISGGILKVRYLFFNMFQQIILGHSVPGSHFLQERKGQSCSVSSFQYILKDGSTSNSTTIVDIATKTERQGGELNIARAGLVPQIFTNIKRHKTGGCHTKKGHNFKNLVTGVQ